MSAGDNSSPLIAKRPASDYVQLGRSLATLQRPDHPLTYREAFSLIDELAQRLDKCAFTAAGGAALTLVSFRDSLVRGHLIRLGLTQESEMNESSCAQVRQYAEATTGALLNESVARSTLELQESVVSETILEMRDRDLQAHQRAALEDTIRCLECGAFRPAIVMGWNFVYDLIRWWVFDDEDRLTAFNGEYRQRNNGNEVTEYADLFNLKESSFLQYCRIAQGSLKDFTDKTERTLVSLLDERNSYAHLNYRQASAGKAQAYVEKVIDVYNDPPFT